MRPVFEAVASAISAGTHEALEIAAGWQHRQFAAGQRHLDRRWSGAAAADSSVSSFAPIIF
jgi:hypothetical protein